MTTETEYQNAVNYLTKLLNGGLMGERGSKPLRIAIEACELQISKQPMQKLWGRKINDIVSLFKFSSGRHPTAAQRL